MSTATDKFLAHYGVKGMRRRNGSIPPPVDHLGDRKVGVEDPKTRRSTNSRSTGSSNNTPKPESKVDTQSQTDPKRAIRLDRFARFMTEAFKQPARKI